MENNEKPKWVSQFQTNTNPSLIKRNEIFHQLIGMIHFQIQVFGFSIFLACSHIYKKLNTTIDQNLFGKILQ